MKIFIIVLLTSLLTFENFAQGTSPGGGTADVVNRGGQWNDNAIWADGTAPAPSLYENLYFIDINAVTPDPITNKREVVSNTQLDFNVANSSRLYVRSGSTLIVKASVIFAANLNSSDIRVESGGALIILGDLVLGKNVAVANVEGVLVVTGGISGSTPNGNLPDITGTGNVYASSSQNIDVTAEASANNTEGISNLDSLLVDNNLPGGIDLVAISEYIGNNGANPLPVDLLYFKTEKSQGARLTWATVSEKDNDYFSIERSEDGIDFYEIAQVKGNGSTNGLIEYSYQDAFPVASVEYYRLKQFDFDGQFESFAIERLELSNGRILDQQIDLRSTIIEDQPLILSSNDALYIADAYLYSLAGNNVIDANRTLRKMGLFSYELDADHLPKGIYVLRVSTTSGQTFSQKFIKK